MPPPHGETVLNVSQVEPFIETPHLLSEYPPPEVTAVTSRNREPSRKLDSARRHDSNRHWSSAAGDAGVPERPLGLHSELIGDGVIDLIEAGTIDNTRKTVHRHKAVSGFALGTRRLFEFYRPQPALRIPADVLCQRSVLYCAERPYGGHQLGDRGGHRGPGLLRLGGAGAQRHLRPSALSARRGSIERGHAHYCVCPPRPKAGPLRRSCQCCSWGRVW